jgi:cell division protein FtsB
MLLSFPKLSRRRVAVGVAAAVVVVIVGSVAWGFGQQVSRAQQMRAEERRLEQGVAALQLRNDDLCAELEFVQSPEYVEYWARVEANMARPGEVVVVVQDVNAAPLAEPAAASTGEAEERPFWSEWWELVFKP